MSAEIIPFARRQPPRAAASEAPASTEFAWSCSIALLWHVRHNLLPFVRGPRSEVVAEGIREAFIAACTDKRDPCDMTTTEWKAVMEAAGIQPPPENCSRLDRKRWEMRHVHPDWTDAQVAKGAKEALALAQGKAQLQGSMRGRHGRS